MNSNPKVLKNERDTILSSEQSSFGKGESLQVLAQVVRAKEKTFRHLSAVIGVSGIRRFRKYAHRSVRGQALVFNDSGSKEFSQDGESARAGPHLPPANRWRGSGAALSIRLLNGEV